ncbi:hypothetical protein UVI_02008690 [Ustilaginoidea virens]|uniref:Uncharacterized protein n=1 Tax=Ustilaginoidea virens TaxID=1159556 RepID=A0A1B5L6V1_USTVR|nr:hypothetical protein UVI_02008690 [Ustilaginoidea virens]
MPSAPSQTNETNDTRPANPGANETYQQRQVPLSAEGGVYKHDSVNEPRRGTAGRDGVSIIKESSLATGAPGPKA